MSRRTPRVLETSLEARRRWRVARRIARRTIRVDVKRSIAAVAIIALPVVLIITGVSAWTITSSPRYVAAQWLGDRPTTQAVAVRIARSSIAQDPLGSINSSLGGKDVTDDDVAGTLEAWVPNGDRLEIVETVHRASVTRVGAAKSTSVEDVLQTASLDAPEVGVPGGTGKLAAGRAAISDDLADELGVSVGSSLVVSTAANAADGASTQKASVVVDSVFEGERRLVIGEGTLDLATYPVGGGSTSAFYVVGSAPVTWEKVLALNSSGFLVISRAVLADPPAHFALEGQEPSLARSEMWRPFVIVVGSLLVLIELVLLVTPIFAVAQNRAIRTAATILAIGGDHADQGRLMTAIGQRIGLLSSAVAVVLVAIADLAFGFGYGLGFSIVPWQSLAAAALLPLVLSIVASISPARDLAAIDSVAVIMGKARAPSKLVRRTPVYPIALLLAVPTTIAAAIIGSLILLALGVGLLEAGLIGSAPYAISKRWRVRDATPIGVRLALRDAVRNGHRTLPAMASLMTTTFIAAGLLITLTSANEAAWNAEAHLGPRGSVLVSDADASDSTVQARAKQNAAAAAVADERSVKDSATLRGMPWASSTSNGPALVVEAVSPNGGESLSLNVANPAIAEMDLAYIVDDGTFLATSGIVSDDAMVRAVTTLTAGGAILPDERYIDSDGTAELRAHDMTDALAAESNGDPDAPDPTITATTRVPATAWSEVDVIVLSPKAAAALSLPAKPIGELLVLDRPVSAFSAQALSARVAKAVPGTTARVIQQPVGRLLIPRIAAFVALIAAAGTVALVVVLSATDMRPDFETLEAMGATSELCSRVSAYQGIGLAVACVPVSVLSGLFAGVLAVVAIARSGAFPELVGLSPVIPWAELVLVLVGAPLVAVVVARAVTPRGAAKRERVL